VKERRWKPNPGKSDKPRNPEAKVYLKFRQIDPYTKEHYLTDTRVRAGNYNWRDRALPFDIIEATDDDP
jgi:hypothetical protein